MNDRHLRNQSVYDLPPILTYESAPGVPPVSTMRFRPRLFYEKEPLPGPHSHDFLVIGYFDRDGGSLLVGDRKWQIRAGDAFVIAPGEVTDPRGLDESSGWAAFFLPEILGAQNPGAFLSWRSHPLLFPFVRGAAGGAQRLRVPAPERPRWSERFAALDVELQQRQDGYQEAVMAHLVLLLVGISRLAADIVEELRLNEEPLLADVFGYIEKHFHESISLRDVAWAVSLSPGHLTTVVRRKTGRTVQGWIAERRLAEARRLLTETDLSIEEVGQGVGYNDPVYFVRSFKRAHGATPLTWRRAGRSRIAG